MIQINDERIAPALSKRLEGLGEQPKRGQKLITFTRDSGGYQKGRSQYYTQEQAQRLIDADVGFDANNGGHQEKDDATEGMTEYASFVRRVEKFTSELGTLYDLQSLAELSPKVAELKKEYDALWHEGEWTHRTDNLRLLQIHAARITQKEAEAQNLEGQIKMRLPGGTLYVNKFLRINAGRQRAQSIATRSPDADEVRRAKIELDGLDQIEAGWNLEIAKLKSQLKTLRG